MHSVKIEAFEGPLSLLLKLIEEEELDITKVSLARVTDQYLIHLRQLTDLDLDELADFLVIAAKLLLIKSKILLPDLSAEDQAEIGDLEAQLRIYKEFLDASKVLHKMISKKRFLFFRPRVVSQEVIFSPPQKISQDLLRAIFQRILSQIQPIIDLPEEKLKRVITLEEKISEIQNLILNKISLNFRDLIATSTSRTEIIVSFLALLELVKQSQITICQENTFEEIVIRRI